MPRQPTDMLLRERSRAAILASSVAAIATGAMAIEVIAVTALAIGRLAVKKARFGRNGNRRTYDPADPYY